MSNEAVIVGTARTPIGTAYKGSLVDVDAFTLGGNVVVEAIKRSGIDPGIVDDIVLGESLYGGGVIARYAAVAAGLTHVPGAAVNRHCASGLSAVQMAAASIMAGMDDVIVAGGVQSTSTAPRTPRRVPGTDDMDQRWLSPSHPDTPDAPNMDMTITVGMERGHPRRYQPRDMDAWAARSHARAIAAIDDGRFESQIVPVELEARDGDPKRVLRRRAPASRLHGGEAGVAAAPLHPEIPGFSITAGNSSGLNDGAAALVIADRSVCDRDSLDAAGDDPLVGVDRRRPGRHRAGACPGDRTRPWSGRGRRSATWRCGRSTRPSPRCRSPRCGPSDSTKSS